MTSVDIDAGGRIVVAGGPTYPEDSGTRAASPRCSTLAPAAVSPPSPSGPWRSAITSRGCASSSARTAASSRARATAAPSRVWDWRTRRALAQLAHGRGSSARRRSARTATLLATTTTHRGMLHLGLARASRAAPACSGAGPTATSRVRSTSRPAGIVIAGDRGHVSSASRTGGRGRVLARLDLPSAASDVSFDASGPARRRGERRRRGARARLAQRRDPCGAARWQPGEHGRVQPRRRAPAHGRPRRGDASGTGASSSASSSLDEPPRAPTPQDGGSATRASAPARRGSSRRAPTTARTSTTATSARRLRS